jgi:hypothetical protein
LTFQEGRGLLLLENLSHAAALTARRRGGVGRRPGLGARLFRRRAELA